MSPQIDQVLAQASSDPDVVETREWLDALESVIENEGPERAHFLVERLVDLARQRGSLIPFSSTTPYINTIPPDLCSALPRQSGDRRAPALLYALERNGNGGQSESCRR